MFKINPNPTFDVAVKIPAPGGEEVLTLVFKHKTRDQLKGYFEEAAKAEGTETKPLLEIIGGWKNVDAEFSEENLLKLIQNYHNAVPAIFAAYLAELTQAKLGN